MTSAVTLLCGAVAAWPLAARAQQSGMPTIVRDAPLKIVVLDA